uniref:Uncharacterized protein n=1 Tax=Rhizophora mucronata TaxID=61149 RepID=A0A2P2P9R0_RHIMU
MPGLQTMAFLTKFKKCAVELATRHCDSFLR